MKQNMSLYSYCEIVLLQSSLMPNKEKFPFYFFIKNSVLLSQVVAILEVEVRKENTGNREAIFEECCGMAHTGEVFLSIN